MPVLVKVLLSGRPEEIRKIKPKLYSEKCIFVSTSGEANIIFLASQRFDFKEALYKIDSKYNELNKRR